MDNPNKDELRQPSKVLCQTSVSEVLISSSRCHWSFPILRTEVWLRTTINNLRIDRLLFCWGRMVLYGGLPRWDKEKNKQHLSISQYNTNCSTTLHFRKPLSMEIAFFFLLIFFFKVIVIFAKSGYAPGKNKHFYTHGKDEARLNS